MGDWKWVIVGYAIMGGALGAYTWWLRFRLARAARRVEEG